MTVNSKQPPDECSPLITQYYEQMALYIAKLEMLEESIEVARQVGDWNFERMWLEQRHMLLNRMLELQLARENLDG